MTRQHYMSACLVWLFLVGFAQAQIIYTDYGNSPREARVGTGFTNGGLVDSLPLPGTSALDVGIPGSTSSSNLIQLSSGPGSLLTYPVFNQNDLFFLTSLNAGQTWSDLGGNFLTESFGNLSTIDRQTWVGGNLRSNPTYIPFTFNDTSDGNLLKYGYAQVSSEIQGTNSASELVVFIHGYGYEDSGNQIAMGAIPEPSSAFLLGAVTLGALYRRRR